MEWMVAMDTFNDILIKAVERGASDIHFTVGMPPISRIDGALVPLAEGKLLPDDTKTIAYEILNEKYRAQLEKKGEVDLAYSIPTLGRFRVNVFLQRGSIAVAVRILNFDIPSPETLGIPGSVVDIVKKQRGLVLVTGPTGSGKSTTLASLINVLNENYPYHIITLEDPIEYLHRHKKSIVNQREIGSDTGSYASGLRAALREDPDVILVGEMRDLETIAIAVTAAETDISSFQRSIRLAPPIRSTASLTCFRRTSSSRSAHSWPTCLSASFHSSSSCAGPARAAARRSRSCISITLSATSSGNPRRFRFLPLFRRIKRPACRRWTTPSVSFMPGMLSAARKPSAMRRISPT